MSSTYYDIYLRNVLNLVGTVVIKSEVVADSINAWLTVQQYAVDEFNPSSWKYYLNLSGQYHVSDKPMTIKSLDTQELIPFTKASMVDHRATKREYTYRSRYYNELVSRYPDQVDLIHGILNPVDIAVAVAAKDHSILYYDKFLVEANEFDLIPRLQTWIDAFYTRWDVPDYAFTESLYPAAQLALLYAFMPKQIINIRLDNCKTDRAHSYHIKQYLTSFGRLDPYIDFLNNRQRLFFYRNIRYLNLNAGKSETFNLLTKKVMTDRFFPLAEYDIRHNTETLLDDLYPTIEMCRTSINGLSSALGADIKPVPVVLELETGIARANIDVEEEASVVIPQMMKNSLSGKLETKVLESNVLDKTDAEPFTLTDVVFNHWIFLAGTGRYNSVFTVTNPNTGEDLYLTAKEMFILWLYTYNKARGFTLDEIPIVNTKRVSRVPMPTMAELKGIVESKYVPDYFIIAALDDQVNIGSYISVDAFKETCVKIHRRGLLNRDLATYRQHFISRGQIEQMVDRFYMDYPVDLGGGEYYGQWLADRSLNLDILSPQQLETMAISIYGDATGVDITTSQSLQDIHAAHVKLMGQLSSYSVQFIQQINVSALKIEDWPYVRMGDEESFIYEYIRIRRSVETIHAFDVKAKPRAFKEFKPLSTFNHVFYTYAAAFHDIRMGVKMVAGSSGLWKRRLPVIDTVIEENASVDLTDIVVDPSAVSYPSIDYVHVGEMFMAMRSDLHEPLTLSERNTLLART